MTGTKDKPLMRSLGEFFGHIIKGIRTDPARPQTTVLKKEIKEEDHGDVILRRTTIEEIEVKKLPQQNNDDSAGSTRPGASERESD